MADQSHLQNEIIPFLNKREYRLIEELGQGACGKTVLLHDESIDEYYVCKKYSPYSESQRGELFAAFVRETKLLYRVFHENVVRVFNHYLYPEAHAGFILMEYIKGDTIGQFVAKSPEKIDDLFQQAVNGFAYLHRCGILHRDIRMGNLMVREDGRLKIIDLGFGKRIDNSTDFNKSITLNWWCQLPDEFKQSQYNFASEVYFVGKLFESLLQDHNINGFKNRLVLGRMCQVDPSDRFNSFSEVETEMQANRLPSIGFDDAELGYYRQFAYELSEIVAKIERGAPYADDVQIIQTELTDRYRSCMLEEMVPDSSPIIGVFVKGSYFYKRKEKMRVDTLREFIEFLQSISLEKKRIVLANLRTRLNAIPRYHDEADGPAELPF